MDLKISIHDENGDRLQYVIVYQDGSDSEGAEKIADFVRRNFKIDYDAVSNARKLEKDVVAECDDGSADITRARDPHMQSAKEQSRAELHNLKP